MKHKLQNLLKHNWRTLLLLLTLITTSQGVWAWDNCRIHGQFGSNKSWATSDNIACSNSVSYDLSVGTYEFGVKSNNDTWLTIGTQTISSSVKGYLFYQGSGNVTLNATVAGTYTFKCVACQNDGIKLDITFPHATIKGTFCSWANQDLPYTVSLEANTSYEFGVTAIDKTFYKNASITSANCTNVTLSASGENATIQTTYAGDYTFTWDDESKQISVTYPPAPCDSYSAPANVVNGTDIMLYAYQCYNDPGTQVGITKNTKTCLGTATMVGDKKHSVIQVASSEFASPFQIYVSNNCGNWGGETCDEWDNQSASDAQGAYYKHENSGKSKVAATTVTVTPSSTSIPVDTESIDLSITGNSATSSYGSDLFALIYVDGTKDGCMAVSTSAQTYELTTSSLSAGSHTIKTILTDGKIYYIGATTTLTVVSCSTHPVATTGTATGIGLQGATLPITISSSASGTCTPTKVGVKLYTSSTCDEEVSGYTFDEATWTTDQAYNIVVSGLSPGNTYYYRGYVNSSLGTNEDTSTSPVKSFRTTACTAPNVTAISNNSQTKCKGVAASQMVLTVEGGVTPYSYAWKQNGSKSTTGATGATGSSNLASYTPPTSTAGTMYYYCVVSSATPCSSSQFSPSSDSDYATIVTNEVPSLSVVPTGTVKNFTPVTISSDVDDIQTWSSTPVANDESVYFYDKSTSSAKFKASVARGSNENYTITGTTSNDCSGSKTVTVTKDTGTCE